MINNEGYTKKTEIKDFENEEEIKIANEIAASLSSGESNTHVIYLIKRLDELKKARLMKTL